MFELFSEAVSAAQTFTGEVQFQFIATALALAAILFYLMQKKRFYFVRHGETLLNKAKIKQDADGALSEAGAAQAKAVGIAFRNLRIRLICSSPYERALQTASLMNETLRARIVSTPLLSERKNASETIGKSTEDPEVKRIMGMTAYGFHEDAYRFSDEENFEDLRKRARACLAYLERRGGTEIAVVTHHAFLQMLLSYMLYRDGLHASDYVKLAFFNPADNGGVTVCDYHPWQALFGSKTRGWEVITYNQPIE